MITSNHIYLEKHIRICNVFINNKKMASAAKQNTPGLGIEYEVLLPAYFALILNNNSEIEDFKLRSNVQGFGNLDDLLVDITTKSGENLYFAFQLKHKENLKKNLSPSSFEARGDFNLEKYCEAFKRLNEKNKKYHFVLYTNKNFDSSRTNEVKKFVMKQDECCLSKKFFDTSGHGTNVYTFEVTEETEDGKNVNKEDYRKFFEQFSLCTGQANIRNLDQSHILDILQFQECYVKYIDFFRRWHRGDFVDKVLDKKTLNLHILDIFLSSVVISYHLSNGRDHNSIFFETVVQQFDITIIDDSKENFVEELEEDVYEYSEKFNKYSEERLIRLGKDSKFLDKFTNEAKKETKLKLLRYFFQKPLILDFTENSKNLIYRASNLCQIQENCIKLVIVGRDIDVSKFSHLKLFTNLRGVDENILKMIKKRCKLYLQGRHISFETIFEDEIAEFITPKEIFLMLKGNFSIGETKENLPECYIPRTISVTVFDVNLIIAHSSCNSIIIFCCDSEHLVYRQLSSFIKHLNPEKVATILVREEECSKKQFDEIYEENGKKDVHLFKVVVGTIGTKCQLLTSTNNVFYHEKYKSKKRSVEDYYISSFFGNSINIFCAQPGMGKSTLMKFLKNNCDPKFWTLSIDLKAHNQFLKTNRTIEETLNFFLHLETAQDQLLLNIKKMFLRKKKIAIYLDGLDEIEDECIDRVLNIARRLHEMGYRIWLSSRLNLQKKLEQYFNIFILQINKIDEEQQKLYLTKRLNAVYDEDDTKERVEEIFNNMNVANSCQILEIPLMLHIISQTYMDNREHYSSSSSQNTLIVTKIFETFFEGKYKHFVAKIQSKSPHLLGKLEEQLENYEIAALHSVLADEDFQKLKIENSQFAYFKNKDFLGIIRGVNGENKVVFEHLAFAEYFASKFLVKNFDMARILKDKFFATKYQNLFFFFNMMLAENSPLHLAIIYKDVRRVQEMKKSSLVDEGGRNFLQIVSCIATRHPLLMVSRTVNSFFNLNKCIYLDDSPVNWFKGEDPKIRKIVDNVLSGETFTNDEIFKWNSLEYALAAGALYVVEAILVKYGKSGNFDRLLRKYYSDEVVAYYSIRFGYHRLLSEILARKCFDVTKVYANSRKKRDLGLSYLIPHFTMLPDCVNNFRILELLIGDDVNKTIDTQYGLTFLHLSVMYKNIDVTKFLLWKGADFNIKDKNGLSILSLSVCLDKLNISKLLLERGAKVEKSEIEIDKLLPYVSIEYSILSLVNYMSIKQRQFVSLLYLAVRNNNFDLVQILLDKGVNWDEEIFVFAIRRGNFQIVRLIFSKGVDLSKVTTALHVAVECNKIDILKYLIENGADITLLVDGFTILHKAVVKRHTKIALFLLNNSKTSHLLYVLNDKGATPLHLAVYSGHEEVVATALKLGIDFDKIFIHNAQYPLYFAAKGGLLQDDLLMEMTRIVNKLIETNSSLHSDTQNIVNYFKTNPIIISS